MEFISDHYGCTVFFERSILGRVWKPKEGIVFFEAKSQVGFNKDNLAKIVSYMRGIGALDSRRKFSFKYHAFFHEYEVYSGTLEEEVVTEEIDVQEISDEENNENETNEDEFDYENYERIDHVGLIKYDYELFFPDNGQRHAVNELQKIVDFMKMLFEGKNYNWKKIGF